MIDKEVLKNICSDSKLAEKVDLILTNGNIYKQYNMCQEMLEYINVSLICTKLKRELPDYNIINIMLEYKKFDENLYNQTMAINSTYNDIDEREVEEDDIEFLLLKIDYIYGYMKEKYEI